MCYCAALEVELLFSSICLIQCWPCVRVGLWMLCPSVFSLKFQQRVNNNFFTAIDIKNGLSVKLILVSRFVCTPDKPFPSSKKKSLRNKLNKTNYQQTVLLQSHFHHEPYMYINHTIWLWSINLETTSNWKDYLKSSNSKLYWRL